LFARECGIEFFETSAKTANNVEEIFTKMADIILEKIKLG
jgi:Ras-related protein Rab-2A